MRYEFKLEALRRYRVFQEEMTQKELAEAQIHRDRETDILSDFIEKRARAEQALKEEQAAQIQGPHRVLYENYLRRLSTDIGVQKQRVEEAQGLYEQKMTALLEAVQKRKTLEKLKEKGFQAYVENLNQHERKFLNELAVNRYARADH